MQRGSCLCGAVAFEVDGPFELMAHCHCGMCRKAHGSERVTWMSAPRARFRWLRGADRIVRYESSPGFHRPFCGDCGSSLPDAESDGERMFVFPGLLEGDPGQRGQAEVYTASRSPWTVLDASLPAFDTLPPGFEVLQVPPRPAPPEAGDAVRGSCLCDGVRFVIEAPPRLMRHCHCSRCRRARAAAHATNLFANADKVRFTRGEERLAAFHVPGAQYFRQVFCRDCGSPQPRLDPERGTAVIPAGALDDDPGLRPDSHIFVGSKAPWYAIPDALPQHQAYET